MLSVGVESVGGVLGGHGPLSHRRIRPLSLKDALKLLVLFAVDQFELLFPTEKLLQKRHFEILN